jgi:hypothetical protein
MKINKLDEGVVDTFGSAASCRRDRALKRCLEAGHTRNRNLCKKRSLKKVALATNKIAPDPRRRRLNPPILSRVICPKRQPSFLRSKGIGDTIVQWIGSQACLNPIGVGERWQHQRLGLSPC